ncbi:MAG: ABC transporter permease [Clostridiales Family XIII bacterium]|jgi:ABC-2 type transport system permease protein|nr:ABC transporter permease [Clostridiales Family XIII bacterium]
MTKIRAVLGFEYRGYIKSKSFVITTIIFVAVILILSQVPRFMGAFQGIGTIIGGGEKQSALVILYGEAENDVFVKALDPKVFAVAAGGMYEWTIDKRSSYATESQVQTVDGDSYQESGKDATDPQKLISDGKYDIVMEYDGGKDYKLYGKGQDFMLSTLPMMLDPVLTNAARSVKMTGMTTEQQAEVKNVLDTTVAGEVRTVGGGDAQSNYWLAYVMLYVLFMSIMLYGQFIVNAVINEKSSKMMELLVTSANPIELMFGKVFGVGMAAFTQIGAIVVAVAASFALNFDTWENQIPEFKEILSQMNLSVGLFVFFILFFVVGYFLYAFICAAVGSTASRVEDAGSVSTLPMMLATASFIVSLVSMQNVDAAYVHVLSFIPFFSPWIMFARLCMASATFSEAAIALAILVAAVIFFGWLSAKIYRVGVMMYGKPMKLVSVVKAALRS